MPALQSRSERASAVNEAPASVTVVDAYHTSGTSPTTYPAVRGQYDTVHLLGAGAVGRVFLERLAASRRVLVAVTDSTATIYSPAGLDARAVAAWKAAGRPFREHP